MSEFNKYPILAAKLDKEFGKIPESGSKLAEKVNAIAAEIKNTPDKKKKQALLEKLLVHIHPLLTQAVSEFYKKFYPLLLKQGVAREDVYDKAVEEMVEDVEKWEDREARQAKGETPSNFTTYFFGGFTNRRLNTQLYREFVLPNLREKRKADEISLNQPTSRRKGDSGELQSVLVDQKAENALSAAIKNQEIQMGRDAVLKKLYKDEDPFLSLIVILKFGLGKDVLEEWKKKYDLSVKKGEIKKIYQRYVPKIDQIMEKYNGEEMNYQEIDTLFGSANGSTRQRLATAIQNLKEQF